MDEKYKEAIKKWIIPVSFVIIFFFVYLLFNSEFSRLEPKKSFPEDTLKDLRYEQPESFFYPKLLWTNSIGRGQIFHIERKDKEFEYLLLEEKGSSELGNVLQDSDTLTFCKIGAQSGELIYREMFPKAFRGNVLIRNDVVIFTSVGSITVFSLEKGIASHHRRKDRFDLLQQGNTRNNTAIFSYTTYNNQNLKQSIFAYNFAEGKVVWEQEFNTQNIFVSATKIFLTLAGNDKVKSGESILLSKSSGQVLSEVGNSEFWDALRSTKDDLQLLLNSDSDILLLGSYAEVQLLDIGNQKLLWKTDLGNEAIVNHSSETADSFILQNLAGTIFCLDKKSGDIKWKRNIESGFIKNVQSNIILISDKDEMSVLDAENGERLFHLAYEDISKTLMINGEIFIVTETKSEIVIKKLATDCRKVAYTFSPVNHLDETYSINNVKISVDKGFLFVYTDIYAAKSAVKKIYCLNTVSGKVLWEFEEYFSGNISELAIHKTNTIIVGDNLVVSLDSATGSENWRFYTRLSEKPTNEKDSGEGSRNRLIEANGDILLLYVAGELYSIDTSVLKKYYKTDEKHI